MSHTGKRKRKNCVKQKKKRKIDLKEKIVQKFLDSVHVGQLRHDIIAFHFVHSDLFDEKEIDIADFAQEVNIAFEYELHVECLAESPTYSDFTEKEQDFIDINEKEIAKEFFEKAKSLYYDEVYKDLVETITSEDGWNRTLY